MHYQWLLWLFLVVMACQDPRPKFDIVIQNISIIDTRGKIIIPNQTVCISGDTIARIAGTPDEENMQADTVIDGIGKYIMSGFWDMHVHTCWKAGLPQDLSSTFLQFGITGLRDMGGDLNILNAFKEASHQHPHLHPKIYGAGPILDGENPIHPEFSKALTVDNVDSIVQKLYENRVDFLKVYSLLSRDALVRVAELAREYDLSFVGHVSEYISPEEAIGLGQKSLEHLNRLESLEADSFRLAAFMELAKNEDVWFCPTMVIYKRRVEMAQGKFFHHTLYEELDADLKVEWEHARERALQRNENDKVGSDERFDRQKRLVMALYDAGLPLLIGTDFAGMPFVYPGYSFHEEMHLLVDMGMDPFDVLRMSSYYPALFLGITDLYGGVERGLAADLVIFNSNPVEDIRRTLDIHGVLKSGRFVRE